MVAEELLPAAEKYDLVGLKVGMLQNMYDD